MSWAQMLSRLIAGVGLIFASPVWSKSNPTLTAFENGIDDGQTKAEQRALKISTMRIDIHVHGRVADVSVEARIANISDATDEARFTLALPADAVVTGYALDVGDRMIDGQLLDQPKARNVYEDEIRKGIDPGLAEVTDGNLFQTRIFPVTREQPRTIRVTFAVPFDPIDGFSLPLETADAVTEITIDTTIDGYKTPPKVIALRGPAKLVRKGNSWVVVEAVKDHRLQGGVTITDGELTDKLLLSRHRKGRDFFQISDSGAIHTATATTGGRLRIYWDRSLSRRNDLLDREIALLTTYVEKAQIADIDLITFGSNAPSISSPANAAALRTAIGGIVYRGGTRLAELDDLKLSPADQCLLFSDGALTVDSDAEFRPDCKLSIITSAAEANGIRLGRLAQASKGQLLRLTASNADALLPRLLKPAVAVVAARDDSGRRIGFRSMTAADGGWFAVGEMPESGDVHLLISGLKKGLTERVYRYGSEGSAQVDAPAALWASQRVAELADNPLSHDKMVKLARDYQVASPTMAFLVLESPGQYLNADIKPPDRFARDWMDEYRDVKTARDAEKSEHKAERLKFVLAQWAERKAWWNTAFVAKPKKRSAEGRERAGNVLQSPAPPPVMAPAPRLEPSSTDQAGEANDADSIVVTGTRRQSATQDVPVALTAISSTDQAGKTIEISIADVLSDQPYLKALNAATPDQRLQVLAAQEKTYGSLPAFYLETSEWFRLKGDHATAEELLYSALELPATDDETRQVVAFRLQRDGQLDRAINMLERAAATTSFRPQPKRALALALAERGRRRGKAGVADLERAFELLTSVALDPAIRDFDGIELIALMEANSLIPALDAVGGTWSLDKRLVALLDTDVRIVIEWTNDDADIDLWVIEPNGEKVYYGDKTSSSGGQISNDMTDGYGPEEYAIRRAPPGEYVIRINGFDADRLNPNGNGRVMARLIRNFGRTTAKEVLVDADIAFEKGSDRDRDSGRLVARMKVEATRK
jgi:hypothetical protein